MKNELPNEGNVLDIMQRMLYESNYNGIEKPSAETLTFYLRRDVYYCFINALHKSVVIWDTKQIKFCGVEVKEISTSDHENTIFLVHKVSVY